ncbi:MAG: DUF4340 domain-containing protein [Bdellovibrionota bacterium]
MNQKTLLSLVIGAVLLTVLYLFAVPQSESGSTAKQRKLFEGVDGQKISKLKFEQGGGALDLALKDGAWRLPARGDYLADSAKIRALLLKLFDLDVSQKVPSDPQAFGALGVNDEAVKRGMSKVSFLDGDGKVVSGVYLGESRRGGKDKSAGPLSGQYVRRLDEQDVYLIASPIPITMGVAPWLEANLVNVLQSAIDSVVQVKISQSGEEQLFELVHSGTEDEQMKAPQLTLAGGIPEGKTLQQAVVTQVRSGLENLRIADVFPVGADEVKDLNFDLMSLYRTGNGLVYQISTAAKGEHFYAKIKVTFDHDLATRLQDEFAKKRAAEKAKASPTPTPTPKSKDDDTVAVNAPDSEPTLKVSSDAEAASLNDQFSRWIYELPGYQARKLRNSKSDLVEPPPPPPAPPAPGAPGMPRMPIGG